MPTNNQNEKSPNKIKRLTDLFKILESSQPDDGFIDVYRGHSNENYALQPSLFRKLEHRRVEKDILRELIAIQPNEFREDKSAFEQLVRMQHYGLPTRLLDFTYNPLVALYFACQDDTSNGEFLKFTINKSDMKYFDSDMVSCISNLSNLAGRQRDIIRALSNSEDLKNSDVGERLLHFIKSEKSYFLPKINLDDLRSVVAVRPKQTNRRIIAQQGGFFLFGLKSTLRDDNKFRIKVHRTKISLHKKINIKSELDSININHSTLFPEIESAAKYIMSKIPPRQDGDESSD